MRLKLLSGLLGGAEYPVGLGDTVFVFGPQCDLLSGRVADTLAGADNLYFVPDDHVAISVILRVGVDDASAVTLQLGRLSAEGHWRFDAIQPQRAYDAGGVYLAVREDEQAWSPAVLAFDPPSSSSTLPAAVVAERAPPRPLGKYALCLAFMMAAVGLVAYGWHVQTVPGKQVMSLEAELRAAPMDFAVAYGADKRLYAVSDTNDGVAWGRRAMERLGQVGSVVFLDRHSESERLGRLLMQAGLDYVVIRLRNPSHPEIVLSRADDDAVAADVGRVRTLLKPAMPYAKELHVDAVSDQWLLARVRDDLRARGISTRVDRAGGRLGIANDSFLDDAGLHAMAHYRKTFDLHWGARRLSINILLWDDVLKGRSFHYTPDQLLSVGGGVWQFNNTVNSP